MVFSPRWFSSVAEGNTLGQADYCLGETTCGEMHHSKSAHNFAYFSHTLLRGQRGSGVTHIGCSAFSRVRWRVGGGGSRVRRGSWIGSGEGGVFHNNDHMYISS